MDQKYELIQRIKDIGRTLIDEAETIVGDHPCLSDLTITCYASDLTEVPKIDIDKTIIPSSFVERKRDYEQYDEN